MTDGEENVIAIPDDPLARPASPAPATHAESRPGIHVEPPDPGSLPEISTDAQALETARQMFLTLAAPRRDALWRHVKPGLVRLERRCLTLLELGRLDDAGAMILAEVKEYLGKAPR